MSKSQQIILVGAILVGGMLIYYRNHPTVQPAPITPANQQLATNPNWATKIDDQASVNVMVTPIDLLAQSKEWKFDIDMNTHVVPLEQDMLKVVTLSDDSGKIYQPLRWEGAPAGGHHREGVLVFSSVVPSPKSVELKISGIGGVERSFVWQP